MLPSASPTGEGSSETWPSGDLCCLPPSNPGFCLTFPRLLLTQEQKHIYAQVARYCNRSADLIPLSFVLGEDPFYFPWYPDHVSDFRVDVTTLSSVACS